MDGMILKVERAPEDSALGNPLDAKVQAPDDFITHLCVQCTIQASHLRSTMREELNESQSTFFFSQIHFCISFITCNLIFIFEILDLAEAMFCPSTSSQESSFGRR